MSAGQLGDQDTPFSISPAKPQERQAILARLLDRVQLRSGQFGPAGFEERTHRALVPVDSADLPVHAGTVGRRGHAQAMDPAFFLLCFEDKQQLARWQGRHLAQVATAKGGAQFVEQLGELPGGERGSKGLGYSSSSLL